MPLDPVVAVLVTAAFVLFVVVAVFCAIRAVKLARANLFPYGRFLQTFIVSEGSVGVLTTAGRFDRILEPGPVTLGPRQFFRVVPTGERTLEILGQELLTADRFQPKLAATVVGCVSDARRFLTAAQVVDRNGGVSSGAIEAVTRDARLALRTIAAGRTLDALLAERDALDAELLAALGDADARYGFRVERASVRDVILPAEVRRAFTEAERARLEGLALLERARAEQATLRSLANAARLLKNSPELMNLRVLQTVEAIDPRKKVTVILGEGAIAPVGAGTSDDN